MQTEDKNTVAMLNALFPVVKLFWYSCYAENELLIPVTNHESNDIQLYQYVIRMSVSADQVDVWSHLPQYDGLTKTDMAGKHRNLMIDLAGAQMADC